MRRRIELAIGMVCLLAALLLAMRQLTADKTATEATSRWAWGSSVNKEEQPRYPAKSPRREAKQESPSAQRGADHLWIAEDLIGQGNLQAAREHLGIAIAMDDANYEAQFLRDTLSESFRPMPGQAGFESKFWRFEIEEQPPFGPLRTRPPRRAF